MKKLLKKILIRNEREILKKFLVMTQETKRGFSLAEVLITLGIIGVVAAVTMPMLITNVRNHVRARRIENIEQKFSKATDKMVALGVYTGLGSTENFVNELGKHLKLAKVCDNDNLQSCWPYEKVITRKSGTTWDIANTKLATDLKMKDDETSTWDKTMGIITADGTSMILSYNTKCDIDETKSINYSGSISSTTGCVAVVYDWNGARKPNKYREDVISLNAKGLGQSCVVETNNMCLGALFIPKAMKASECEEMKSALKISKCRTTDDDYWAGAVRECGGTKKLLTHTQLDNLSKELYGGVSISREGTTKNLNFDVNSKITKAWNIEPVFSVWTGETYSENYGYARTYYQTYSVWHGGFGHTRTDANVFGLCLE